MTVLPEQGENPLPRQKLPLRHPPPADRRRDRAQVGAPDYRLPGTSEADKLVQIKSITV